MTDQLQSQAALLIVPGDPTVTRAGHPELPCSTYTSCVMFALSHAMEWLPLASLASIPVPSFSTE